MIFEIVNFINSILLFFITRYIKECFFILQELSLGNILNIISSILGIITFPVIIVTYGLYFKKKPQIEYFICEKNKTQDSNEYIFDFSLFLKCLKGRVILENIIITPEQGIVPIKHPKDPVSQIVLELPEGAPFNGSIKYVDPPKPFYEKSAISHLIRLKSNENKNTTNVNIIVDVKMDTYKLGIMQLFQPNYQYRFFLDVNIDFIDQKPEKGIIKTRY